MAWLAKKYTFDTYKDEVDRLYSAFWNGEEEDELNAWLIVYRIYLNKNSPRKKRYILRKVNALNKQNIYSSSHVDERGRLIDFPEPDEKDLNTDQD